MRSRPPRKPIDWCFNEAGADCPGMPVVLQAFKEGKMMLQ